MPAGYVTRAPRPSPTHCLAMLTPFLRPPRRPPRPPGASPARIPTTVAWTRKHHAVPGLTIR